MIVIGTALAVNPFNQTVNKIKDCTPCVLFNVECEVPRKHGFDFQDLENKPNRLYIEGKCDETLAQLCRDVGWILDLIAVNPERMEKAGITVEGEKLKEKEKLKKPLETNSKNLQTKKSLAPPASEKGVPRPAVAQRLNPYGSGAKKIVLGAGSKKNLPHNRKINPNK